MIDLVGFPIRLAPGERGLVKGVVEITSRNQEMFTVAPEETIAKVLEMIAESFNRQLVQPYGIKFRHFPPKLRSPALSLCRVTKDR